MRNAARISEQLGGCCSPPQICVSIASARGPFRFVTCSYKVLATNEWSRAPAALEKQLFDTGGTITTRASSVPLDLAGKEEAGTRGKGVNDAGLLRKVRLAGERSRAAPAGPRTGINICPRSRQDPLICFCGARSAHACHIHLRFLSTGIFSWHLSVPRSAGNFAWKFTRSQSFSHCFWSCV